MNASSIFWLIWFATWFILPAILYGLIRLRLWLSKWVPFGNEDWLKERLGKIFDNPFFIWIAMMIYSIFFTDLYFLVKIPIGRLFRILFGKHIAHQENRDSLRRFQERAIARYRDLQSQEADLVRAVEKQEREVSSLIDEIKEKETAEVLAGSSLEIYKKALEKGWDEFEANKPEGLAYAEIASPYLILSFRNGFLRRRLQVSIDLTTGAVNGDIKDWTPDNKLAAMKLLVQGNLLALTRMIAHTLK